jgi:RNA polymerase sigma-70 factor (ECF subfamily)
VIADEDLMREVAGGSRAALEALFERYRGPIWRFFRRRVADSARAEELAQEVFLALLRNAGRYEPRSNFRSYLFAIAFNLLLAERRSASKKVVDPIDHEPAAPRGLDADASLWVRRALGELDRDDREILMLREYEQLSYQEIAVVCRLPLNTVRTRLFRAREALRAALMPESRGK